MVTTCKRAQSPGEKKKVFLFLGGYYELLAVIKTNSELYSVDNRVRCCFPARCKINYTALDYLY